VKLLSVPSLLSAAALLFFVFSAPAQEPGDSHEIGSPAKGPYTPATASERVEWWTQQSFGPRNWIGGAFTSGFWTWRNKPPEWGSDLAGFSRRYATRQTEVTLSTAAEASLGATWGEDPRYFRSGRRRFWGRVGWAISSAFLAHRSDGRRRTAWARGAAFLGARAVTSTWRPESDLDWWHYSVWPLGTGFGSRIAANLFLEFAPDVFERNRSR